MRLRQLGWLLGILPLSAMAACDVSVGKCGDAGCFDDDDWFDESGDDAGRMDAGDSQVDGGVDGGAGGGSDGGGNADAGPDAGDDLPRGEPLSLQGLCEGLNDRWLEWAITLEACCTPAEFTSDAPAILALFGSEGGPDNCLAAYKPLVDAGKIAYNEAYGGDCVADFLSRLPAPPASCPDEGFNAFSAVATIAHGAPVPAQVASCRSAMAGTVDPDGQCSSDFECKNGYTCKLGLGDTKTCQAPAKEGGLCNLRQDGQCAPGLTCVGQKPSAFPIPSTDTGVCRATLNEMNCSRTKECVEGKYCDIGADNSGTFQCVLPPASTNICLPN